MSHVRRRAKKRAAVGNYGHRPKAVYVALGFGFIEVDAYLPGNEQRRGVTPDAGTDGEAEQDRTEE